MKMSLWSADTVLLHIGVVVVVVCVMVFCGV